MGIVNMGAPASIALELARPQGATAFVETGTHRGGTTRWAAQHFEKVYTIGLSRHYYDEFAPDPSKIDGVTPLLGDSRQLLPTVLAELGERRAVHWLDGHWTGGLTAGVEVVPHSGLVRDRLTEHAQLWGASYWAAFSRPSAANL